MATSVFLLDAFPASTFGGNIAGVVLLEAPAADGWMQAVAVELGAPTTGFVDLPSARRGSARVRFFTPQQEIDACGHVTVAIATVLVEQGIWSRGAAEVHAAGGHYPLMLSHDNAGVAVEMQQQLQHLRHVRDIADVRGLARLLGRAKRSPTHPMVVAGTGLRHLLVPVGSVADLGALPIDAEVIAAVSQQLNVDTIGVYTLTETAGEHINVRMRDLCAGMARPKKQPAARRLPPSH